MSSGLGCVGLPSGCRCLTCSQFKHPAGRALTATDVATLAAWAGSWPESPVLSRRASSAGVAAGRACAWCGGPVATVVVNTDGVDDRVWCSIDCRDDAGEQAQCGTAS